MGSKTGSLNNWSRDNWPLLMALSVVFLLALSALIISILTKQRCISSDIVRNVDKDDTNICLSLSAGKSLRRDIYNSTEMQNNVMSTLTHVIDALQKTNLNKNTTEITPIIHGKVIANRMIPSTVSYFSQNDDVSTILCSLNIMTTSTGVSSTTIVIDLVGCVDKNIVLHSVSPVICSSTNVNDVACWQQIKPIVNGTVVKLVNPDWCPTLQGSHVRLIFYILAITQKNAPTKV